MNAGPGPLAPLVARQPRRALAEGDGELIDQVAAPAQGHRACGAAAVPGEPKFVDVAGGNTAGNCERVRGWLGGVASSDRFASGKGADRYADKAHRRVGREASGEVSPFARSDAVIEGRYVPGRAIADRFATHLGSRHVWSGKDASPELA